MHSSIKRVAHFILRLLKGIGIFIVTLAVIFMMIYLWAPVYKFSLHEPFRGDKLFNPYARMDSNSWRKANFHMHSRMAGGLTDGRLNTSQAIYKTYRRLGYDVFSISDYMRVNKYGEGLQTYVPAYEHGYGIWKNHQLCIGSKGVSYLDYPFGQTLNDKQHIIDVLKKKNEIVTIAHPQFRKGYSPNDFRYLRNYDLLEALNHYRFSLPQWDAALSSGYPAYIIASDDAHDVNKPGEVGRCVTFINSPSDKPEDIISNLKAGNAYGVSVGRYEKETIDSIAATAFNIPKVNTVTVRNDSLFVAVSTKADAFRFISQDGNLKSLVRNNTKAVYPISKTDPYIRTEILFAGTHLSDSITIYLNPVYRYSGDKPVKPAAPEINTVATLLYRLLAFCTLIFILINIFVLKNRSRRKER
ncbi:MAG: PHP-associated domain-containing protein [Bacteroidota bacterium]|nr:PHP-associated domain-containing protein [Bacteroidota bacterium]